MSAVLEALSSWRLPEGGELRARLATTLADLDPAQVASLRGLGSRVEALERGPWLHAPRPSHPDDPVTTALWDGWASGRPWEGRARWEAAFLPAASRAFCGVLVARSVPIGIRSRALEDLREAFFHALLIDGARELAARVVETGPGGPLVSLVRVLPDPARAAVARCGAARGGWAESIARLWWDRPDPLARARVLVRQLGLAEGVEALADAHVILRLVDAPADSDPWQVVVQNRGRLRGRLRASVGALAASSLFDTVRGMEGLTLRTQAAVAAWAWRLAWREIDRGFAFGGHAGTPCLVSEGPPVLSSDERGALRTWVLLVILRGRLPHLRRWVRTGGTGDRDSTWGRLCAGDLPLSLRDADAGYTRVRAELADLLDADLEALRPLIRALAEIPPGRRQADQVLALLQPGWSPMIPLPKAGFPTMVKICRERPLE